MEVEMEVDWRTRSEQVNYERRYDEYVDLSRVFLFVYLLCASPPYITPHLAAHKCECSMS